MATPGTRGPAACGFATRRRPRAVARRAPAPRRGGVFGRGGRLERQRPPPRGLRGPPERVFEWVGAVWPWRLFWRLFFFGFRFAGRFGLLTAAFRVFLRLGVAIRTVSTRRAERPIWCGAASGAAGAGWRRAGRRRRRGGVAARLRRGGLGRGLRLAPLGLGARLFFGAVFSARLFSHFGWLFCGFLGFFCSPPSSARTLLRALLLFSVSEFLCFLLALRLFRFRFLLASSHDDPPHGSRDHIAAKSRR